MNRTGFEIQEFRRECPSFDFWARWSDGDLSEKERQAATEHLVECSFCTEVMKSLMEWKRVPECGEKIPRAWRLRLRREAGGTLFAGRARWWGRGRIWLVASVAAIGLSFCASSYYKQFLVIALLSGLKWIVDSRPVGVAWQIWNPASSNAESESSDKMHCKDR
ncbi:MAG: hypothetical protein HQL11_03575, partial [Candidatus Omnitrophica bacterium]|nr:hypothetical protein [Candidatus Omnitrophota bacterium]